MSPAAPVSRRLYGVPEAAAYLGTSERFIRRLVFERRITFVKNGRFVQFDVRDLDAYIEANKVEPIQQRALVAVSGGRR